MSAVTQCPVARDEDGIRLDRWFKLHYPALPFGRLQKLVRTGQIRVDGGRAKTNTRLEAGQEIRVPPLADGDDTAPEKPVRSDKGREADRAFLREITLYEDEDILVLNKPHGLASQGGSGTTRHVDGLLEALANERGERPHLVHRLDRDTAGVLVIAKTRRIASDLGRVFRSRSARKIYWAVVQGVPKPAQGRISAYLAKMPGPDGERMRLAAHGEPDAQHSISHYSVIERAAGRAAWLSLKPVTGRTHQLRVHAAELGTPIVGDPKYGAKLDDERLSGLDFKLHLLARRIVLPHPRGKVLDVTAPLPEHMKRSFDLLGFDVDAYDRAADLREDD